MLEVLLNCAIDMSDGALTWPQPLDRRGTTCQLSDWTGSETVIKLEVLRVFTDRLVKASQSLSYTELRHRG